MTQPCLDQDRRRSPRKAVMRVDLYLNPDAPMPDVRYGELINLSDRGLYVRIAGSAPTPGDRIRVAVYSSARPPLLVATVSRVDRVMVGADGGATDRIVAHELALVLHDSLDFDDVLG